MHCEIRRNFFRGLIAVTALQALAVAAVCVDFQAAKGFNAVFFKSLIGTPLAVKALTLQVKAVTSKARRRWEGRCN